MRDRFQPGGPARTGALVSFAALLAVIIVFSGCGGGMVTQKSVQLSAVSIADGQFASTSHPQVAKFDIVLPAGASIQVEFGLDQNYGLRTWQVSAPSGGGNAEILVAGMRPFTTYHMHGIVQTAAGDRVSLPDHSFTTSGLAAALAPQFVVTRGSAASPASGIEFFDLTVTNGQIMTGALDLGGNLIWHYLYDASLGYVAAIRPTFAGTFALIIGTTRLREIDLAGLTQREILRDDMNSRLSAAGFKLQVNAFHHDVLPIQNGHLIVLCEELRDVATPSGTVSMRGDALVDLDANWKPVWTWSSFDHLDVNRHPMDVQDWTHGNALVYSPRDGALLLSMRNQHWILKIDYANGGGSGNVLWRLGTEGDFKLAAGGSTSDWFFGQHMPWFVGTTNPGTSFNLALFDNRATNEAGTTCATDTSTCYSRPLVLSLDENARTVSVQWQQRLNLYSLWGGNAQVLANNNVEYTLSNPFPSVASRTVEVDPATGSTVWQLDVVGQLAYRAYRVPSLYPGVQW